jgi:DNA polymerase III delta subunit
MINLLVGPDRHLVEQETKRILQEIDPDGLNTTRFEKSAAVSEIANAVATVGFLGQGRVLVAEGIMDRARPNTKGRKVEKAELEFLFSSVAPDNTLILVDPDLATVPRPVKEAAGTDAILFGGKAPRGTYLIEWVQAYVGRSGARIERHVAQRLLERLFGGNWREVAKNPEYDAPPNLFQLSSELDKLIAATDGGEIGALHVDELVAQSSADELFPLVDAVVQGRAEQALNLLDAYRADDEDASRILNQLVSNAELGQIAKSAPELAQSSKEFGHINAGRWAAIERTFSRVSIESFAGDVLESDRRLKTGYARSPVEQLHEILVRRASKTRGR